MKFFAAALGFCAVAIAAVSAVPTGGVVNTGHSAQFRSQDSLGNYAFGYNEDHATGGTFRRESGSPGLAEGSYGLRDIDGRVRVVNYVADGLGFRANVQTNEPGVDPSQDPASVLINKAAAIVAPYISKAPIVSAPLAIQQSIEAPIVQKYEPAPQIIEQAPIVQKYEQAPIIEQIPQQQIIQQSYEPALEQRYEQGPALINAGPIVQQKYEQAPIIEQAPIVQQSYEAGPASYGPSPLVSGYTTKTYAAPAPILSAAGPAYGPGPAAYGPAPIAAYGPEPIAQYATKSAPAYGISSAALLGGRIASPAFAAKGLSGYGYGPLIKKK